MDQSLKEKTLDKLTRAQTIIIAVSATAGFDCLAAGLALYLSLSKLGKNVTVIAKPPTISEARRLYGVDKIGKTAASGHNLTVVLDDAVSRVDKVTYFLEGNKLKIVVHPLAGAKPLSQNQVSFDEGISQADIVFIIGYSNQQELEKDIVREQLLDPNIWTVSVGKQQTDTKFAHVNYFFSDASGFSELTAHLIKDLALPVDEDLAYNLYMGIEESCDNFSPSKTSATTHEVASWLLKFGAGRASLAQKITIDKPPPSHFPDAKEEDWLKPPKIYKGSKSFDSES